MILASANIDDTVLLFYKDFERDTFFRNDRYLKRVIRPAYNLFSRRQKLSGFYVWFLLLAKALREQGYNVRINDYATALHHPEHPVGIVGYPHIIDGWKLPNPAVLGPAMYDHPQVAPTLMKDSRYQRYIVTCDWMREIFEPVYGSGCVSWYAGIDLKNWQDTKHLAKDIDLLIYDKVRWNRTRYTEALIQPIMRALETRGLRHQTVRYGEYDHGAYHDLLARSKGMIFLCEHETQGMAYQEALASNVPVLAWDNGYWLDPRRPQFDPHPISATSVPYFSDACGERFADMTEFASTVDRFWSHIQSYEPREFVARHLSMKGSADIYMHHYRAAAQRSGLREQTVNT